MVWRLALAAAPLAFLLGTGLAGEADPGGERWYVWRLRNQPCGYFHVVRKATQERDAPVLLEHDFVVLYRGRRLSLHMRTWCRDDACLTPVRIASKGEGDDELGTFEAAVAWDAAGGGLLKTQVGQRKVELRLPERTVTDFALFEIVARLPFKEGEAFEFNSLEASELNLKPNHRIAYLGQEEVTLGGESRKLHKFEQTGQGIRPARYWVSGRHELVRILMDDRKEFLLASREEALEAAEQAASQPR